MYFETKISRQGHLNDRGLYISKVFEYHSGLSIVQIWNNLSINLN